MVGGYALRYALDQANVGAVTVIGRKKVGISHPKLTEVLHPNHLADHEARSTRSPQASTALLSCDPVEQTRRVGGAEGGSGERHL